jgi:hypothetical protein
MENRPTVWNGTEVPYGVSVAELAERIHGPAPARWAAFVALAHAPGASALAVLQDSAGSPDAHVRRIAVEAIGVHAEGSRLGTVVRSLLSDRDPVVVRAACEAAGRQHLVDAHDSIARLLDADDASTRAAAVRALRELWRKGDFERVFRVFTSDASDAVRKEAAWTLRSVTSAADWRTLFGVWQVDPLPRHRKWACELAAEFGGRLELPALHHLTGDVDGHVRDHAAQALREFEARGLTAAEPDDRR